MISSSQITGIRFSALGTEDIRRESFVPIISPDLFKGKDTYKGGLYDRHLGTFDYAYNCQTCFNNKKNCYGHDGHTNMNYPVLSPLFVGEIRKWLQVVCFVCGNIVLDPKEFQHFPKSKRLDEATRLAKVGIRSCPVCGTIHPSITKDKERPLFLIAEMKDDKKKVVASNTIYPHMAKEVLNMVSDVSVELLGKSPDSHPRKFVLDAIKIPPTTIRPDVKKIGSGRSMSDNLTTLLKDIIKYNEKISPIIPDQINREYENLIYAINELYYNFVKGSIGKKTIMSGSNAPINSLMNRIKGKGGRLRKFLQGKRVRLVARSTITGDSTKRINQIGIPLKFAKTLQVEETVHEYNKSRLMVYYLNGREKYPGCSGIIKRDTGALHGIDDKKGGYRELQIGDILLRDVVDGDVVLFNRQPSLLPSNLSAMEVSVIMDPAINVIQMNVVSCPAFNADFDGDQMNIFLCSNIAARNEISQLSAISNFFIKHAYASPIFGQADDSIIGSFCLTRSDVKIDKYHAMLMYSNATMLPDFSDYDPKKPYSGRDLESQVLQETPVNFKGKPTYFNKDFSALIPYKSSEIEVVVKNGKLIKGVLDKKTIGKGAVNGLYHLIYNEYGAEKAMKAIYNMQHLAINYLGMHGMTFGIRDLLVSKETLNEVYRIEAQIIKRAELITEQLNEGEIVPPVGKTIAEHYEELQKATLRVMDDFADPILKDINPAINNFFKLAFSGSKGSINHIFHVSSAVGQIIINDKRPKENFAYKRTLPHFQRFDMAPSAHGFIRNSYISGMSSTEFAFNAMNGRNDMIAKALSTSVTGESERKSIKNLESIVINNLRLCVKNENIIQMVYGEDGLDTRKIVRVEIPTILISNDALEEGWRYKPGDKSLSGVFEEEFAQVHKDRDDYRKYYMTFEILNINEQMTNQRYVPIDVKRALDDLIFKHGLEDTGVSDKELAEMVSKVRGFTERLPYTLLNDIMEEHGAPIPEHFKNCTWMLSVVIRAELNSKRSLRKLAPALLDVLLGKIRVRQLKALAEYGATVGLLAAMSFSEPFTQYMLDAHHRSTTGGTSKGVLVRVKEVLSARPTSKLSDPHMFLTLHPEFNNEAKAKEIANHIQVMRLVDFISIAQVFFEKFKEPVHPKYRQEKAMIEEFIKMNPLLKPPGDLINWCIRFAIDKTKLIYKNMTLELIITRLRDVFPGLYFVYTPENAKKVIIRAYAKNTHFRGQVDKDKIVSLLYELKDTVIRGIPGINFAEVQKLVRNEVKPDGSLGLIEGKLMIKTYGTNLTDIMKISAINAYEIQTDAIEETQQILGIEAARQQLITSIRNLGAGGLNHHHVTIYADEMTTTGKVTSIERQGLSQRESKNVLLRMGFSFPGQVIEEASVNSIEDKIKGVTSPLLIGTTPNNIGTAYNSFHMNEELIQKNIIKADTYMDDL